MERFRIFAAAALLGISAGPLRASVPGGPSAEEAHQPAHEDLLDAATRDRKISDLSRSPAAAKFQLALESARSFRLAGELKRAERGFIQVLEGGAPEEMKRAALLDLAVVMQDQREYAKAQQLFSRFVRQYDKDPSVPEVLLRQAYLYRQMGVPTLALAKFYGVISTCLNLQVDQLEYYQKLVLRAQAEIAETYFLDANFAEAADYYERLLRLNNPLLAPDEVLYKLARCYSVLEKHGEAAARARLFLDQFPGHAEAPETRFLLASALKKLGRTTEALGEIRVLLDSQEERSAAHPAQWQYWRQRAGNEIANQLYREGDYLNALQIYQALAAINTSPEWQIPVWYQIGLVFENLKQHQKALEMYDRIIARGSEAGAKAPNAALRQVAEMAAWRKQYLAWEAGAQLASQQLAPARPPDTAAGPPL